MYVLLLLDNSKTYISTVDRNNFSEASKIKKKDGHTSISGPPRWDTSASGHHHKLSHPASAPLPSQSPVWTTPVSWNSPSQMLWGTSGLRALRYLQGGPAAAAPSTGPPSSLHTHAGAVLNHEIASQTQQSARCVSSGWILSTEDRDAGGGAGEACMHFCSEGASFNAGSPLLLFLPPPTSFLPLLANSYSSLRS